MLRGKVEAVSEAEITGWALDDATPDQHPDISIFVDGKRLSTVACRTPPAHAWMRSYPENNANVGQPVLNTQFPGAVRMEVFYSFSMC